MKSEVLTMDWSPEWSKPRAPGALCLSNYCFICSGHMSSQVFLTLHSPRPPEGVCTGHPFCPECLSTDIHMATPLFSFKSLLVKGNYLVWIVTCLCPSPKFSQSSSSWSISFYRNHTLLISYGIHKFIIKCIVYWFPYIRIFFQEGRNFYPFCSLSCLE